MLTAECADTIVPKTGLWCWTSIEDDAHRIERTYRLKNFHDARVFVDKIGELAESEGHHPDIRFGWGYVTISLQTKRIKGLHENDFIMAAKIDRLAKSTQN